MPGQTLSHPRLLSETSAGPCVVPHQPVLRKFPGRPQLPSLRVPGSGFPASGFAGGAAAGQDGRSDQEALMTISLSLPIDPDANELLSRDPLALLIGMLLDQQVPLEKAFSGPLELAHRLGHEPTAAELAGFDPDALAAIFSERPALHRYPKAMAGRVQDLARLLVSSYDGDAARVWTTASSGAELLNRISALPGF